MVPVNILDDLLRFKDSVHGLYSMVLAFGSYGLMKLVSNGENDFDWFLIFFLIFDLIGLLVRSIINKKLRRRWNELVQRENHEIATVICDHGVINPSSIKPLLNEIATMEDKT